MERQPDAEGRAASELALNFDASPVGADDALHDHQAQTGAFLLGGIEGLEDPVELFLGNAAPGIGDADPDAVGAFPGLERQRSRRGSWPAWRS